MNAGAATGAMLAAALACAPLHGAGGDASAGEAIYARCAACHALAYDRSGPRHCGLIGRRAGSVPGFAYSEAMRRSGIVWDAPALDRFLADPMRTLPGTSMTYAGIADGGERADLIAFLAIATASAACRGSAGR